MAQESSSTPTGESKKLRRISTESPIYDAQGIAVKFYMLRRLQQFGRSILQKVMYSLLTSLIRHFIISLLDILPSGGESWSF